MNITINNKKAFNNITGISLTVTNTDSSSGDDSSGGNGDSQTDDNETETTVASLEIIQYNLSLSTLLGSSNTSTVVVNNTGNESITVKLNVTINSGIDSSVAPNSCSLAEGENCTFNVSFNVSNSTTLGEHPGTLKAYVSTNTSIYNTKSFTFTVLATEEREEEINVSYQNYADILEGLALELEDIRISGLVSKENLTVAEFYLNESNSILNQIKEAISSGDYITAESLLATLNESISNLMTELDKLKIEKERGAEVYFGNMWIWIVIGVVIAGVVVFFIYLLLPPKEGFHTKYGFKPKQKEGLLAKLKNAFNVIETIEWIKLKNKFKRYGKKEEKKFRYKYKK
jgi:hypothetical protein